MGRKLLLADDSVTIQKVVALTFMAEDMEIITASDGQEALDKLAEIVPDVALLDVFMPHRTGYEVCAHIRQTPHLNHIPVILLVGAFEPFDHDNARHVGANDYLTKPFQSIRQLITKVNQLLAPPPEIGPYETVSALEATPRTAPVLATPAPEKAPFTETASAVTASESAHAASDKLADTFSPQVAPTAPLRFTPTANLTPSAPASADFDDMGIEITAITYPADSTDDLLEIAPLDAADAASENVRSHSSAPESYAPPEIFLDPLDLDTPEAVLAKPDAPAATLPNPDAPIDAPTNLNAPALDVPELAEFDTPPLTSLSLDTPPLDADDFALDLPAPPVFAAPTADASVSEHDLLALDTPPAPSSLDADAAEIAAEDADLLALTSDAAPHALSSESDDAPQELGLLDLDEPATAANEPQPQMTNAADAPAATTAVDFWSDDLLLDLPTNATAASDDPLDLAAPSTDAPTAQAHTQETAQDSAELLELEEVNYAPIYHTSDDEDLLDIYEPPPAVEAAPASEPAPTTEPAPLAASDAPAEYPLDILDLDLDAAPVPSATNEPTPQTALTISDEVASETAPVSDAALSSDANALPALALATMPEVAETPLAETPVATPQRRLTLDDLAPEVIDAIARRVVELMSDRTVQEIAWEIVPDMAEVYIKRQLEKTRLK